jgi:hypothetical protein
VVLEESLYDTDWENLVDNLSEGQTRFIIMLWVWKRELERIQYPISLSFKNFNF